MNTVRVNGRTIEIPNGSSLRVEGDAVYIDGKLIETGLSGVMEVRWEGPLCNLTSSAAVQVKGDVRNNVQAAGSVMCGNVGGDVKAGGAVNCGDVGESVYAGGSVRRK